MYRDMDIAVRAATVKEIARQLDILEATVVGGPYIAGAQPRRAAAAARPPRMHIRVRVMRPDPSVDGSSPREDSERMCTQPEPNKSNPQLP